MNSRFVDKPIVVGVFPEIAQAQHAIGQLLGAGFKKDQLTVICSDREKESHFREYEHQEPAGYYTGSAITDGAVAGATIGAVVACAVLGMVGMVEALIAGLLLVPFGVVAGGFIGAMMTRGVEKELANFYDQGVVPGDILVAAEDHSDKADKMLVEAEKILTSEGVRSMELPEG